MARYLIPLVIFIALSALLFVGLQLNPREVPSPLIGKAAPAFSLPTLDAPERTLSRQDLLGKVYLMNVWASWCVSCRQEHPLLVQLAKSGRVPIYGLNYKDERPDAQGWLRNFGNPYTDSIFDADGRVGIDFGVYGVPETFVIDARGMIRHKVIGPITPDSLTKDVLPLIDTLKAEAAQG